jgi:hypothetical protein
MIGRPNRRAQVRLICYRNIFAGCWKRRIPEFELIAVDVANVTCIAGLSPREPD